MIRYGSQFVLMGLVAGLALAGCGPKPTPSSDIMASAVAEVAFGLLTETAAAASSTPTATPKVTPTEAATETPTDEPRMPMTVTFASCGLGGPESSGYAHEVNTKQGRAVDVLGRGSIDGYVVIRDWKFQRPCWIRIADLKIFPGIDWSKYPVMTPGVPSAGQ